MLADEYALHGIACDRQGLSQIKSCTNTLHRFSTNKMFPHSKTLIPCKLVKNRTRQKLPEHETSALYTLCDNIMQGNVGKGTKVLHSNCG